MSEEEKKKALKTIVCYSGKIITKTGMLIGGPESEFQIGGIDKVPVHHKGEPYIPGSSLKGKLRSLLEIRHRGEFKIDERDGGFCQDKEHRIGKLFGTKESISRLIVRDAFLDENCKKKIVGESEDIERLYEIKMETAIDRIKGTAKDGSLRTFKRTVPGLEFNFEMILLAEDKNEANKLGELLEEAFGLLKHSYLGGSGSRGYGQVDINWNKKEIEVASGEAVCVSK